MKKKFVVNQEIIASLGRSNLNNVKGGEYTQLFTCECYTFVSDCAISACQMMTCNDPSCHWGNCARTWEEECVIDWDEECTEGLSGK